jgi:hypothetical protein
MSRCQWGESPKQLISVLFRPEPLLFIEVSPNYPHKAECNPFQTHCFSENLVAPVIRSWTSGSVARNSDYWTTEAGLRPTCAENNQLRAADEGQSSRLRLLRGTSESTRHELGTTQNIKPQTRIRSLVTEPKWMIWRIQAKLWEAKWFRWPAVRCRLECEAKTGTILDEVQCTGLGWLGMDQCQIIWWTLPDHGNGP